VGLARVGVGEPRGELPSAEVEHHEEELARQRAYRAAHPDLIRKYNQHYHRNRKQRKAAAPGQALLIQEVVKC